MHQASRLSQRTLSLPCLSDDGRLIRNSGLSSHIGHLRNSVSLPSCFESSIRAYENACFSRASYAGIQSASTSPNLAQPSQAVVAKPKSKFARFVDTLRAFFRSAHVRDGNFSVFPRVEMPALPEDELDHALALIDDAPVDAVSNTEIEQEGVEEAIDYGVCAIEEFAQAAAPLKQPDSFSLITRLKLNKASQKQESLQSLCKKEGLNPDFYQLRVKKDRQGNRVSCLQLKPKEISRARRMARDIHVGLMKDFNQLEQQQHFSLEEHIKGCVQSMVDSKQQQDELFSLLNSSDFSAKTFSKIEDDPSEPNIFWAFFGDKKISFSNRTTLFELRADALKKLLAQSKDYGSLYELLVSLQFTKYDTFLRGFLLTAKLTLDAQESRGELDKNMKALILNELSTVVINGSLFVQLCPDFFEE